MLQLVQIMFTKKDLFSASVTGFYTGLIAWQVLMFLNKPSVFGLPVAWFIVIIPILWILGVNLGYFLGRWMPFFNQFGRFAAVGFTNFAVYTGILNIFLWQTKISSGAWYSFFVAVAFLVSVLHSYGWNKYWVFESGQSGQGGAEFGKFIIVTGIAGLINVAMASFVVNALHPMFGTTPEGWANIGGIAGSAVALVFSFVGIRLVVFKKN